MSLVHPRIAPTEAAERFQPSQLVNCWAAYAAPGIILLVIALFYITSLLPELRTFEGNYSGFVRFARFRAVKIAYLKEHPALLNGLLLRPHGYDGQFYYYMALDPFLLRHKDRPRLYRSVVDSPRYRYGRIGFPLLIKLFSLDRPEFYPQTMIWLILAGQFLGTFFLMRIARFLNHNPLWALLYLLIPGPMVSLHAALPEPIACAFLLGGIHFYLKKNLPAAVLLFQLSILIRETGAICVGILTMVELLRTKNIKTSLLLGCSVLPYFFWKGYLTWRLFPDFGWTTLFFGPRDFGKPFGGILDLFLSQHSVRHGLLCFAVLICANLMFGIVLSVRQRDWLSMSVFGYSLLHVCLNYPMLWSSIGNIERTTYEGFLFLVIAFMAHSKNMHRLLSYSVVLFLVVLGVYDVFFSAQSVFFRAGLLFGHSGF